MKKDIMVFKFDSATEIKEALKRHEEISGDFRYYYNVVTVPRNWKVYSLKGKGIHIGVPRNTDRELVQDIFEANRKYIDKAYHLFGDEMKLEIIESANTIE